MWPIQFAFRLRISCRIFLCSLTLSNTSSFLTWSVQLIFSILLQHHISELSRKDYINEKSSDTIGNRTRDLPVCSAVPQLTTQPRAPKNIKQEEIIQLQYLLEIWDLRMCYTNCTARTICIVGFRTHNCQTVYNLNTGSCILIRIGVKHFLHHIATAPVGQGIPIVED